MYFMNSLLISGVSKSLFWPWFAWEYPILQQGPLRVDVPLLTMQGFPRNWETRAHGRKQLQWQECGSASPAEPYGKGSPLGATGEGGFTILFLQTEVYTLKMIWGVLKHT